MQKHEILNSLSLENMLKTWRLITLKTHMGQGQLQANYYCHYCGTVMEVVSFEICSKIATCWRQGACVFSSMKGKKKFQLWF